MWIQLLKPKRIEVNGKPTNYNTGDWVNVGRQYALLLISQNEARCLDSNLPPVAATAGFLFIKQSHVAKVSSDLKVTNLSEWDYTLPYSENFLIGNKITHYQKIPLMFDKLKQFDVIAPLTDSLALYFVTNDNRDMAKSELLDLRTPVYNADFVFFRRNAKTQSIVKNWKQKSKVYDSNLALTISLFRNPCLLLALPTSYF